jgi:hypothetical protein
MSGALFDHDKAADHSAGFLELWLPGITQRMRNRCGTWVFGSAHQTPSDFVVDYQIHPYPFGEFELDEIAPNYHL